MNQPIHDYTGRSEGGTVVGGGEYGKIDPWSNDFTRMQEEANTQALYDLMGKVFPVHPVLAGQVQELARMIMDSASGQGTTTAKDRKWFTGKPDPSDLDRVGGLIGKWTGNAVDDVGQALGMTSEDLIQTAKTVRDLGNDPHAQLELLSGITQSMKAKYGGDDGPLAALEDFGAPGLAIAAKGPRIIGNLLQSGGGKHLGMPDRVDAPEFSDAMAAQPPRQDMPLPDWEGGSKDEYNKFLEHDEVLNPGGYQTYVDPDFTKKLDGIVDADLEDLIDALSLKKWDKKGQTVSDHDTNLKHLAMAEDELRKRQTPLHQTAMDELEGIESDLGDAMPSLQDMPDDALDAEIMEFNKILNSGDVEGMGESSYIEHLENLVKERRRRRKAQGDSGAAYGYSTGGEGYVDPAMVPKDPTPKDWPDIWKKQVLEFDDDMLDAQIAEFKDTLKNKNVKGMEIDGQDVADYTKQLQDLLAERKKRQGGGEVLDPDKMSFFGLKIPDEVVNAIKAEDALGFSTAEEAAFNIWTHPDWDGRWEIVSEDNKKIIKNWVASEKRKKGGGGSAGAQKAQGSISQMISESGKVPADLPDMPGGAIGKLAYNIENFHAGADIGNVPQILENAKFVSKRNMWHFPVDPDVGVFDLNGFFNRMAHPKHELNADEISVLARVLDQAKSYPSRRNLSSMAEDLYKTMVSGPAKSGLEGIGFNIQ
jgi:hypothetical protein